MSKKVRNILIVIFLIFVLILSGCIFFRMHIFDSKKDESKEPKQAETTSSLVNDEEQTNEDEMLPSDEDVKPEEPIDVPGENTTTTTNKSSSNNSSKKTTTKKTTTKKADTVANNSGRPSVSTAKFDSDINSVKLNPMKTRNTELDNKVGNIINSITNSSMTNNQKLYAVFRYIIDHSEYGNGIIFEEELVSLVNKYHYKKLDATIVYEAQKILDSGYGVCDDYASLFVVMARRLGFDAYFVGGGVKKASGGTTGHAWANILANGTYYVFDPQIADKRPAQEKYYYGKTDKEITIYTYDNRESYIKSFNRFKETAPLKLDVKLSGAVSDEKSVSSYRNNIIKDVEYKAYVGGVINLNIKTSGASKYTYNVRVKPTNVTNVTLYAKQNDTNNNLNLSYKFEMAGRYAIYTTVWSGDTGIIAEYYFNVTVTTDDRIKDINVNYTTKTENKNNTEYYYVTFKSDVVKYDQTSTCIPTFQYTVLSTDREGGIPYVYASVDGGKPDSFRYYPGYSYNVKVTATCGSEKFEKTITFKE